MLQGLQVDGSPRGHGVTGHKLGWLDTWGPCLWRPVWPRAGRHLAACHYSSGWK